MAKMKVESTKPSPIFIKGNNAYRKERVGVLLIHGFTGTTAEMQPLSRFLADEGYTVHAPLLKGHGCTPEEMACTSWVDWYVSAEKGYERLQEEGCTHIVPIGLSMGGILALKMAQRRPVKGLATLCSPIRVRDRRLWLVRYLQHVVAYKKRKFQKAEHIEKELYVYDRTPLSCVASLEKLIKNVSYVLPKIKQPILIVQSEKDETVHPESGQLLYDRIGSYEKELAVFPDSSHIITLDHEKEKLHAKIHDFLHKLTSTTKAHRV